MDHEYELETGWKQLGPLANSVLRTVMEKRMRQAEMTTASPSPRVEAAPHPARREFRAQLDLPLFSHAVQVLQARQGQGAHRL